VESKRLGDSGVEVSVIGFGAWTLGLDWWGKLEESDSIEMVRRAVDLGITFFDTGDVYGLGRAEEILGRALEGMRDRVVIGTKFGYELEGEREHAQGERPQCWEPEFCRKALEESLKRLRTDYIDLYQLHNPRLGAIQRDDLFAELESQRQAGKIRAVGVALGPAIGWEDEGIFAIRERRVDSVQTVYNVLEQEPGRSFANEAAAKGYSTTLLARVPHASDVLSEKVDENTEFSTSDHRSHRKKEEIARLVSRKRKLEFLKESGRTMGQAALAYIIAQPAFSSVLLTVTSLEDLEEYAAAADKPLTSQELERVEELWQSGFGESEPIAAASSPAS
jgi:aryl-alcohol dehydrogenase-like predicted oxidoreductase